MKGKRLATIRDAFLRGTLERRTSKRRELFRRTKEPSHNGRRSHGLCHPGPTRRRPSLDEPAHPGLATTRGMFHRASPCPRVFCTAPYGRWRKQHFFGPRRSDRILQHDCDARARPDGLLLLSSAGLRSRTPSRDAPITCVIGASCGESCILRDLLDEPLRERHPCALLDGSAPRTRRS